MGLRAAIWHLLNFFGPAIGVGLIAPLLVRLVWRHELRGASWLRMSAWTGGACALVLIAGLLVFGRDGMMASYAAMLLASSAALWWSGFGPARR